MSTITQSSASITKAPGRGKVGKPRPQVRSSRRTTVTLSPDSQRVIERFKSATGTSTSAAIDQIIRRSEPRPSRLKESDLGLLVLDVPIKEGPHFTIEDIKQAEDDLDREYIERFMPRKNDRASKAKHGGKRR